MSDAPSLPAEAIAEGDDVAELLAEGWRILKRLKDADDEMRWEPDHGAQAIVALAQDNAQSWALDNFEFLLRAASERDAAVRALREIIGEDQDLTWDIFTDEQICVDGKCAKIARAALASAAQGGANG